MKIQAIVRAAAQRNRPLRGPVSTRHRQRLARGSATVSVESPASAPEYSKAVRAACSSKRATSTAKLTGTQVYPHLLGSGRGAVQFLSGNPAAAEKRSLAVKSVAANCASACARCHGLCDAAQGCFRCGHACLGARLEYGRLHPRCGRWRQRPWAATRGERMARASDRRRWTNGRR